MSKNYYTIRAVVRGIFWTVVMGLSLLAMWAFYMAVWSLQF